MLAQAAENGKGPSLHAEVARLKTQLNEVQRDMSQIKRTLAENGGPAAQSAVRVRLRHHVHGRLCRAIRRQASAPARA